ncbi:hypothetical protein Q9L58_002925 [Maublancomyces gigas]|uniref:Uncharacterized protein n=1 Tax=Discina gigas TaxID=1032678 RepID=A0ABR3GQ98_9PEZI
MESLADRYLAGGILKSNRVTLTSKWFSEVQKYGVSPKYIFTVECKLKPKKVYPDSKWNYITIPAEYMETKSPIVVTCRIELWTRFTKDKLTREKRMTLRTHHQAMFTKTDTFSTVDGVLKLETGSVTKPPPQPDPKDLKYYKVDRLMQELIAISPGILNPAVYNPILGTMWKVAVGNADDPGLAKLSIVGPTESLYTEYVHDSLKVLFHDLDADGNPAANPAAEDDTEQGVKVDAEPTLTTDSEDRQKNLNAKILNARNNLKKAEDGLLKYKPRGDPKPSSIKKLDRVVKEAELKLKNVIAGEDVDEPQGEQEKKVKKSKKKSKNKRDPDIHNRASVVSLFERTSGLSNKPDSFKMLFTGDAHDRVCSLRNTVDSFFMPPPPLIDVLKKRLPHHGSLVSTSLELYDRVKARVYLICAQQKFAGSPYLAILEAIASSATRKEPTHLFFSNPYSLHSGPPGCLFVDATEGSNLNQLLRGKFAPGKTDSYGRKYNYICYILKPSENKGEKNAGIILLGHDTAGKLIVTAPTRYWLKLGETEVPKYDLAKYRKWAGSDFPQKRSVGEVLDENTEPEPKRKEEPSTSWDP